MLLQSHRVYEKGIDAFDKEDFQGLPEPHELADGSWRAWRLTAVRSLAHTED